MSEAFPANKLSRLSNAFTLERRFDKNYEVSDEIGIGGFAKVFKAKNLLDNIDYAMKKIVIKTKNKSPQIIVNEIYSILTEIRCFAKIKHKHIVRYNHSWIEIELKNDEEEEKTLKNLQNNKNKPNPKSKRSISNDYSRSHITESDLCNESHISNGSSVDKSELDYTFDLSYQIEENGETSNNNIKENDDTKSDNDSLLEFNDICSNYHEEEKEKEHLKHENAKDQYSFLLRNCEKNKKNKRNRKTSNFSKRSKENPEHLDKRRDKEYKELKFNQHKENIHKFKDEFNHAKERKKQNNFRNKNNNNRDQEEELKNEVKIIINNTEYNVSKIKKITLILQMELCKETLENYIHRRNNDKDLQKLIDEQSYTFEYKYYLKNLKIFLEIAKALNYLHTKQNIIHRDLKPQNIFFSFEELIKIGDFGLATDFYNEKYYNSKDIECLKNLRKNSAESNNTEIDTFSLSNPSITNENTICYHTKNIGTFLYASPEQLNVNFYDYKSDIYSLGFILYELLCPFRTSMERKIRFSELKSGKIIDFFREQNKTITDLIILMTDTDANKRPDALKIIEIIKDEINRIKILNFPNDIEEFAKLTRIGSQSSKDSNENSQNSDITEESSSIVNNNKSSTYFQDEDSKLIKDNIRSNFVNLIHAVNDSFHLKPNSYKAESMNNINNTCYCSKIDSINNNNQNNYINQNDNLNNYYFNSKEDNSDKNTNNNFWEQRPKSTGFPHHHEILRSAGIYIKVCFYEGDHIPSPDAIDINAISYKNYMNSIHIRKYLKIIKNKLMIFSDENSKKADQIYEMEDCEIIYDSDFENENKPEYLIFIVHPYLKNISLYFNTYPEYFNFVEFFSNVQN